MKKHVLIRSLLLAGALSGAMGFAPGALAQQNTLPASTAATTKFAIRGFELQGDVPLSANETSSILAPFIRADSTLETLQQAAAALEAAFRAKGYALHAFDLQAYQGQTIRISFTATEDWLLQTSFVVDDVSLNVE